MLSDELEEAAGVGVAFSFLVVEEDDEPLELVPLDFLAVELEVDVFFLAVDVLAAVVECVDVAACSSL